MAKLSVKEILEAARRGGPAQPVAEAGAAEAIAPEAEAESVAAAEPEAVAPAAPPPAPVPLGRPLTLKEKLAAARAGGSAPAAPAPKAAPAPAPEPASEVVAATPAETTPAVPAPAPALGRPLTLKEKLAAARGAGATAPAGAAPAAKPAAAKPATGAPAAKAARQLPPLEKMSDPKDLAEALRQAGAKKTKEVAAQAAANAPVKAPAKPKETKPQTVLPKPSKSAATAAAHAVAVAERRGFLLGSLFVSWVVVAWATFTAGCAAFTAMMGRFMFPNVLAEPPSTIKIGLPANFDPEDVNERFKAEWGFWVVRSARVESQPGQDIIYALKSVCTHLGCPPNWLNGEQKFKCPCHGSGFYITGVNFEGPAPRPLERFKVSVSDDGQIVVDKSQIFQNELGQWSDPDSFVPA